MKIFPFVLQLSNYLHQSPPTPTETPHACVEGVELFYAHNKHVRYASCAILCIQWSTVPFPFTYKFEVQIGVEVGLTHIIGNKKKYMH